MDLFMTGEMAPLFVRWSLPHWTALGIVALAAGGSCGDAGGSGWRAVRLWERFWEGFSC